MQKFYLLNFLLAICQTLSTFLPPKEANSYLTPSRSKRSWRSSIDEFIPDCVNESCNYEEFQEIFENYEYSKSIIQRSFESLQECKNDGTTKHNILYRRPASSDLQIFVKCDSDITPVKTETESDAYLNQENYALNYDDESDYADFFN